MLCSPAAAHAGVRTCTARRQRRRCGVTASAPLRVHMQRWRAHAAPDADAEDDAGSSSGDAPWHVGIYYTKRPVHRTDALGGVLEESLDNLVDLPSWDEARKRARMCGL
jgi:hypothetical protein